MDIWEWSIQDLDQYLNFQGRWWYFEPIYSLRGGRGSKVHNFIYSPMGCSTNRYLSTNVWFLFQSTDQERWPNSSFHSNNDFPDHPINNGWSGGLIKLSQIWVDDPTPRKSYKMIVSQFPLIFFHLMINPNSPQGLKNALICNESFPVHTSI